MTTSRDEIYSQVTDQIISDLEGGHIPCERPWSGGLMFPQNASTQTIYNGINTLILWMRQRKAGFGSSQWLTLNQARELGASIKKGEKATRIIYYQPLLINEKNDQGEMDSKSIPMLKTHSVFNICQCEGLESLVKIESGLGESPKEPDICEKAEAIFNASGAKLAFDGGTHAFYPEFHVTFVHYL